MADYDLLDGNLTDCLLQAEVVRACLCQQSPPWRCQDQTMDAVGSVAGWWRWKEITHGCLMRRAEHTDVVLGISISTIVHVWE